MWRVFKGIEEVVVPELLSALVSQFMTEDKG